MLPWLLAALLPAVQAAEPDALDRAWYLAESSRIEDALAAAACILHEDPTDVGAHRLYAWLQVKALRDAQGAEALYREWLEIEPDNDAARIVLANQLLWTHRHPGDWCAEAESLLVQPPRTLEDSYFAQRVLFEVRKLCPGDQEAPRMAIIKLAEQVPEAQPYALRIQLIEQPVDEAAADALEELFTEQPWRLTYAGNPWKMRGPEVERVREAAIGAAVEGLASDDPLLVESARRLFRYAGDQERLLEAEDKLQVLDPEHQTNRFRRNGATRWVGRAEADEHALMDRLRAATRGKGPRRAATTARGLEADLPDEPAIRAAFYGELAQLHDEADQPMKALEAARQAWLADPSDPYLANDFAYRAATAGQHLDQALDAVQGAVSAMPAYDARGDHPAHGYDDWLVQSRSHAGAFADTYGWVLYRLARYEEASAQLRTALLLDRKPTAAHHLHLGLTYDKLGDTDNAMRQLGRGLALADGDDPELERLAYKRLAELWPAQRWAPGGLETWIALQDPLEGEHSAGGKPPMVPLSRADLLAGRNGDPFPDLSFEQDGQPHKLSEIEGVRVVDLWATWCGPCVKALPELDKLAEDYADRGVTIVAISVDAGPEDVVEHFGDDPPEHLVLGWAGRRAMREARITGIPKTFVIDADGTIRAIHSGWDMSRGGDKSSRQRIAESIDALLEAE